MNFKHKYSLRSILLIVPVATFILMSITFGVLTYIGNSGLLKLEDVQRSELEKSKFVIKLGSEIAKNHVKIYQVLRAAEGGVDEGEFYDNSKPLLLEIHRIEKVLETYLIEYQNYSRIRLEIISFQAKLINYRVNTTNAILVAAVDLSLAQKLLRESTEYYIGLNNDILKIIRIIQEKMGRELSINHSDGKSSFAYIFISAFLVIIGIVIIGVLASRAFTKELHEKILTLESLLTKPESRLQLTKTENEIEVLAAAVEKIKINTRILEDANKKLGYKEGQLTAILNNMVDSVMTINEGGAISTFNNAAAEVFGYTSKEMFGENIELLINDYSISKYKNYLKEYLTSVGSVTKIGIEIEGLRKDKTRFPMYLSISKLPTVEGSTRGFVCSCHDLSIMKEQQAQLQRSQKMDALGKLTGGIAHDFNNMLSIILGYAALLKRNLHEQPKLSNYITEIQEAGNRGAELTKRLLSFSKRESTSAEVTNINTLLMEDKGLLDKALTANIKLIYKLADDLWLISIDGYDLLDAIINMSINAMHAMENHGEIFFVTNNIVFNKIEAQALQLEKGNFISLSITDTGCGIGEENINKIFEPFFTSKGHEGTGLGLSQVYNFVQRSKGAIQVDSELGRGTCMTLYFPQCVLEPSEVITKKVNPAVDLNGTETVLVVDDEPALIQLSTDILQQHGYHVISVDSAKKALEVLEKESVDLLFTDIIMPEMGGYELASIVQKKYPNIKIQLVSGFDNSRHKVLVDIRLQKEILYKPYKTQIFLEKLRNLFNGTDND